MGLLPAIVGAITGALFGSVGSYYVLVRLVPRKQGLSKLRLELFEFLRQVTEYWTAPMKGPKRALLEARILAQREIIGYMFRDLSRQSKPVSRAYQTTTPNRLQLWNAATGGSFQSSPWSPDPERAKLTAAAIGRIIRKLPA